MQNNLPIPPNQSVPTRFRFYAACLSVEDVSALLGLPTYTIPLLMRARHLKPLGKPAQNARKWFARVEIEAVMQDRAWLDKAVFIVERYVSDMNLKRRRRTQDAMAVETESENSKDA